MNIPLLATELLLNATRVNHEATPQLYDFVLDNNLTVIECAEVESLVEGIAFPVPQYRKALKGVLFELNHVRVNPHLDNSRIIGKLIEAFRNISVGVINTPDANSMALCYKPLGEILDNVRFHFDADGQITFLTPHAQLHLVDSGVGAQSARIFEMPPRRH